MFGRYIKGQRRTCFGVCLRKNGLMRPYRRRDESYLYEPCPTYPNPADPVDGDVSERSWNFRLVIDPSELPQRCRLTRPTR